VPTIVIAVELGFQAQLVVQASRGRIGSFNLKACVGSALLPSPGGKGAEDPASEALAAVARVGNRRLEAQQRVVDGAIGERCQPSVDPQAGKRGRHDDRADDTLVSCMLLGGVPLQFSHRA
jgi:hypothetical protein